MNSKKYWPFDSTSLTENVYSLFEQQAQMVPDTIAVIDDGGETSYANLASQSEQICRFLQSRGLNPEQPIGVLMERNAALLAVLLGILKAGGAYIPIDLDEPDDRIIKMLRLCGSQLVFSEPSKTKSLLQNLPPHSEFVPEFIHINDIPDHTEDIPPTLTAPGEHRLAYLLFTSGTTGEPKAVEVEHINLLNLLSSACELLRISADDRYLATSTVAFDVSATELFLPLVTGGSLLLRDKSILLDHRRLVQDVLDHHVSIIQACPSVWSVLFAGVDDFPRIRIAISHGEALSARLACRLCEIADQAWNLYGPTETTVWATGYAINMPLDDQQQVESIPIGRPLKNINATIVDDLGNPVGNNVEGELCLGGLCVARGYCNDPVQTNERFQVIQGNKVYRTGDIARRDQNGVLHFLGRKDDQIKCHGIRIEPAEIEAKILSDSRVEQVFATWFATGADTRSIVAGIVTKSGHTIKVSELKNDLSTKLPKAMIPARILFLSSLPMTPSGKVDHIALRKLATVKHQKMAVDNRELSGPKLSITESAIADIWKKMLHIEIIRPKDQFFSIGGDSLLAAEMMIEIEALFKLQLPAHLVFETPSLGGLARKVDQARNNADEDIAMGFVFPVIKQEGKTPVFFCHLDLVVMGDTNWKVTCPIYAVIYWARGSGFVKTRSLEELAAAHIKQIRQIQKQGPYRLAGYSLGGIIAMEMARQLQASGEVVEHLFLLDPMAPIVFNAPKVAPPKMDQVSLWSRFIGRATRIVQGPNTHGWEKWISDLTALPESVHRYSILSWIHFWLVNQHLKKTNKASRLLFPKDRYRAFWFAASRMVKNYIARPYIGPATVVLCEQNILSKKAYQILMPQETIFHTLDANHLDLYRKPIIDKWTNWLCDIDDT